MSSWSIVRARLVAGPVALLLAAGTLGLLVPGTAQADSAPPTPSPATPTTVTADGLPTVQMNGVAWSQVVVGDTVYVAGSFSRARPAGAAAGTQETVRNNLLAYDIHTGNLITSFAPSLNGQARVITASPDGSRIYVGGDFTQVDGQTRNRVAALTPAGDLVGAWRPSISSQVRAIAATNEAVYLGGSITAVGGVSRSRLAAVSAADGALLPWAPVPGVGDTSGNRDGNFATSTEVLALVVTGGGSQVVAAGRFDSLNGTKATGVGALDAVTGETRPFAVNQLLTNQGVNSAVWSLSTAEDVVYGTAYDFYGPGNLEGSFAARADGGAVVAINACHGDTYSSYAMGGALYLATHAHQCAPIGGYPEQDPRVNMFATAVTTTATRTVQGPMLRGISFVGQPGPSMLDWFPTMSPGSFTGQGQAGWSVAGNGQYVVYGGEFPRVNGVGQQGLVRYAVPALAPNKFGPSVNGFTASAATVTAGVARVSWQATNDQDNEYLTYRVYRDGDTTTPVHETTRPSTWWNQPSVTFSDSGLSAGTHRYRVVASDPFGNTATTPWATVEVAAGGAAARDYTDAVRADGADHHWPLGESSGTTAFDHTGAADLPLNSGVTQGRPGATGDGDTAYGFDGTSGGLLATQSAEPAPNVFSVETWFQTTTTLGGKILGYGSSNTGISSNRDRHVYMDTTGRLNFGVYTTVRNPIGGTGVYNDGQWHHVVATLGPDGMALYVDGQLTASRADVTAGQAYNGYWRIGGDRGWAGADYFTGVIDDVAVYPTVLSPSRVANHFSLGATGEPVNVAPTAAFSATPSGLSVAVDAADASDSDGTLASYAWDFGDGATLTGAEPTASHTYPDSGTYTVRLTVTDDDGATASATRPVTVTAPPPNQAPVAAFTAGATDLAATFDGSGSSDSDGTVASYDWDFGDGGGSTGPDPTVSHAYSAPGTYTVTLTVTDDDRATGAASDSVTVTAPPANTPPTAAFTSTAADLTADFDAAGSGDGDGSIAAYVWAFGDGEQGTGATPSHTYEEAGTYPVTLTVTDDDGATGTTTADVTVTAPAGPGILAEDTFDRTVTGGLGTAPVGGPWTASVGGTRQSVESGVATLTLPAANNNTGSYLGGISQTDVNVLTTFSVSSMPTGSGTYVYVTGRRVGANQEYRVRARLLPDGRIALALSRLSAGEGFPGAETILSGVSFAAGDPIALRVQVSGTSPTAVTATVWRAGTTEPAAPQRTWTDTTAALQAPGSVGLTVHRPGNTTAATEVRFSDVRVTGIGAGGPPANTPPSPSFAATATDLNVVVDASTSTDADGTIVNYAWNWGDSTPAGSGVTASHPYARAGEYTITLTATDNAGATATATRTVTVSAPVANQPPTAAFTATENGLTVTFNASNSSDADGFLSGYSWNFGDGQTSASGPTVTHAYEVAGTYPVTLQVTDDDGASGDAVQDVSVEDVAEPAILVNDAFDRTVTNGLGAADVGGTWTVTAGGTRQSVTPGVVAMTLPAAGNNTASYVSGGIGDANILTTFSLSSMPTGNGTYVYVTGRRVADGQEYRVRVRVMSDGRVALALSRLTAGAETFPGGETVVPGLIYAADTALNVRVVVSGFGSGTTQLATTVWAVGAPEPTAPQMTRADTTAALQAAGGVGLAVHRPSGTTAATAVRFTAFRVTELP
jgi:PKD repeat protein